MHIILAGAAGNLGIELTRHLVEDGHDVTALDASLDRLEPWRTQLKALHAVDLRDPETLDGKLAGGEMVITTVGIGRPRKLSDFHEVDYQGNLNLLHAARQAGIKRFIYTSVAQVQSDTRVPLLRAKHAFEQELQQSGLDWLIIRPSGYFTDIWNTFMKQAREGKITLIRTREPYRFSPIHPADVAAFVAANLARSGESVALGGPQDFSYREISELCFELLGQPAQISMVPLPIFNLLLGALRLVNPTLYSVMLFLRWASTTDLTAPQAGSRTIRDYLMEKLELT